MNDKSNGTATGTELGKYMRTLEYEWSNEAQVYYHHDYVLPTLTSEQALYLYEKNQLKELEKLSNRDIWE